MKKLPLGIQTFRKIIDSDNLYVDKTKDIYNLLSSNESNFFFLSRPRRFGKSLLISTLEEMFLGNKELFRGLWIYDKIEWKKYPVIRIDFSIMLYTHGTQGFEDSFFNTIISIATKYNIILVSNNYKEAFQELLEKLGQKEKVVILIDEYDKPIINFVDDLEIATKNREILKNFYETIKSGDQYIKFAFLTGVSKFSKVSVFSGLNNLRDITLSDKFATLLGYTSVELQAYFSENISQMAKLLNVESEFLANEIRNWYNGYSWDGKSFVYNPFSILYLFTEQKMSNYWFSSGTPTFLIKMIKKFNTNIMELENYKTGESIFESYDIDKINVQSLLFQTGYLTIKQIEQTSITRRKYTLSYPNLEVKESLLLHILSDFSDKYSNESEVMINDISDAIEENNLEAFFDQLKNLFASIPSVIFMSDKEAYYHTIIYLILTLIGVRIKVEVHTNKGRIDAVIETKNNIYVLEFKMSSAVQAIKQIESKKYYEQYLLAKKKIILVGVSFDSSERNISEWKVSSISGNET